MKRWLCLLGFVASAAAQQDQKPIELQKLEAQVRQLQIELQKDAARLHDPAKSPANVALTVYLVSGLSQPQASGKDEVPQDLAETLQQLHGVFTYKSYKLIEEVTLRGRNFSAAQVAGVLPDLTNYDFNYKSARISPETPHIVHLDALRLLITRRHSDRTDTIALVSTDLDVREGQKTVVGKSAINGTDAIFLVIVAKVVD